MKLLSLFLLLVINSLVCLAQPNAKAIAYVEKYKDIAMYEMVRSGVPASITLAQGLLESGFGESELCLKSNNHFGIKCKTEWMGEKVYHNDDEKGECFRKYNSAEESYKDHSDFLRNRPHYSKLFELPITDYEGWAKGLKKAGYATEKDYPQRLIKIIENYNLHSYTLLALNNQESIKQQLAVNNTEANTVAADTEVLGELVINISSRQLLENNNNAETNDLNMEEEKDDDNGWQNNSQKAMTITDANKEDNKFPAGIFTINHTKVMFAKKGTSLLYIAQKQGISFSKLLDYNDMADVDILPNDQLIFLGKKLKKGNTDYHVVKNNETLHEICQIEGIRLESLLEFNQLKKDTPLNNGTKIYLRAASPIAVQNKMVAQSK